MVDDNEKAGQYLYESGDKEIREWLQRQWSIWPTRADQNRTTNLSLHYGALLEYRLEHGAEPEMSDQFRSSVQWLDKHREAA